MDTKLSSIGIVSFISYLSLEISWQSGDAIIPASMKWRAQAPKKKQGLGHVS
jgi:hypothetical protein